MNLRPVVWLAGRLLAPRRIASYRRYCQRTAEVQAEVLLEKIRRRRDSAFGRDHGFAAIRSVDDFRRCVPLGNYENHRPYIERVRQGDLSALLAPDDELLAFHLSSGTTATPKYIPVTQEFFELQKDIWYTYHAFTFHAHPEIIRGKVFPLYSPTTEKSTQLGVPCGSDSGLLAERQNRLLQDLYAVPREAYQIMSMDAKYYALARFGLAQDVSLMIGANPGMVATVARTIDEQKEPLLRELADGTFSPPEEIPAPLEARLAELARERRNPERARCLDQAVERSGRLLPRDYWPNLALVATWKGGTMLLALEEVRRYFEPTPVRELGLHSSEGRFTVTVGDAKRSELNCLALTNIFYEFIPEAEAGSERPGTLLAHELEVGDRYLLVVTTSSGFYRYQMDDLVEVTDWFGRAPVLQFLNKRSGIIRLGPAKIYEYQLVEAVREACRSAGNRVLYFRAYPGPREADPPYFEALFEEDTLPAARGDKPQGEMWVELVDRALARASVDYETGRAAGRIGPMSLRVIPAGTFEGHKREVVRQQGIRLAEQYKHRFYVDERRHERHFRVLAEYQPEIRGTRETSLHIR